MAECLPPPQPCNGNKYKYQSTQDGAFIFRIEQHHSEAFQVMNELRYNKHLCDVTIQVEDKEFYAHKVVLASSSSYFRAMFTSGFGECKKNKIEIKETHPCVFALLVDFAYTSTILVNEWNVLKLLTTAIMFQMNHVVNACCQFLEHQLDPSNCIGIAGFSKEYSLVELHETSMAFICKNFREVSKTEEFMNLNLFQLVKLVSQDRLNVMCESEVYNACLQWIKHDECGRRTCFNKLLGGGIRCSQLTPNFLKKQLQHCNILKCEPKCKDYLAKIFQDLTLHKKMGEKGRIPPSHCVIYSAGGYLRHSLSNMECYYPESNSWIRLADLPEPRSGLSAVTIHGTFFAVGGRNNSPDGNMDSNSLDAYDPITNTWKICQPMNFPRNRVGVGVIDGLLYAVGGSQGCRHHNTVERYDPKENTWTQVASMHTSRIGVGCAVANRLLYAIGGYDGTNRLKCVECYYPETDEWKCMASMNTTRSGAGVAAIDNQIYAVGGYDGTSQLNSVERYDIENNTWCYVASMNSRRSALSVAVLYGKLFALGGYDGSDFLATVEVYDAAADSWNILSQMSTGRSGAGVAVGMEPCLNR
ncbi:kelch-like ECH-associated protein 1 [Saccoglossus kowalevskii]|uniref:Kelch-like ECH-associated protein 1-like n=1 Tax=Saccoglossus kowalevskii TaxID=10224 RepID=A0ABM0GZQ5_SACKO|nr:PREDICTED: kelch-like ECH-associated protein 1-like [Saccoglossus kowalevskii]